ncbi:MAG: class D sortase [Vallitalea sp.]|jgi:sortase A|nr:class D sortase [Vallitalea sp.]
MRRVLSVVLIIGGMIFITIPFVGRYRTKKFQQKLLKELYLFKVESNEDLINSHKNEKLDGIFRGGDKEENKGRISSIDRIENVNGQIETLALNTHSKISTDNSLIEDNNSPNNDQNKDNIHSNNSNLQKKTEIKQKPKAVAVIKIDKIDVNLPIANGIDLETLKYSIGYMPGSGKFGEIGNAVLAGHRSHTYGVFFNRLNELENDDKIIITIKDKEYVYTVYEKKIVEPDDISVMKGSSKYKVITLITCDPVIGATHRLIIHGVIK